MRWDDFKNMPMAPTLTRSPEEMEIIGKWEESLPSDVKLARGWRQIRMELAWLRYEYATHHNPLAVWEAWRVCRDTGAQVPAWLLEALDTMAKTGLGAGFTQHKRNKQRHRAMIQNFWRAVGVHWRQLEHPEERVLEDSCRTVGERTGASRDQVRDAYYQLLDAMQADPAMTGGPGLSEEMAKTSERQ